MDKKEYDRLRYLLIKEKRKQQVKDYYQSNKEKVKEYQKGYNIANRDKVQQRQKEYQQKEYKKDPEKFHKRNKKWRDNNPEKVKAYLESDLYKKLCKIASWKHHGIIQDDWDNIYDIYMNTTKCDYCLKDFKSTLDRNLDHNHNITDRNNIRGILCRVCNTSDVLADSPPIF